MHVEDYLLLGLDPEREERLTLFCFWFCLKYVFLLPNKPW